MSTQRGVDISVDKDGRLIVSLAPDADIRLDIKRMAGEWTIGKNSRLGSVRLDAGILNGDA